MDMLMIVFRSSLKERVHELLRIVRGHGLHRIS